MKHRRPTDDELSAYVDGELSPHDRAQIAHAVATDPSLADQVAALARLKSVMSYLGDELALTQADLELAPPSRRPAIARIAAAVAVLILLAGVSAGGYWGWRTNETANWVAEAKDQHLAWIAENSDKDTEGNIAKLVRGTLLRIQAPVHVLDLSGTRLTLSDVAYLDTGNRNTAHSVQLRYTGHRGCQVSLRLSHGPSPLGTALHETDDGLSRGFYWRAGEFSYALFATGMDRNRFSLLARNVYEATRDNREPPEQHQRELRIATDKSTPCRV